MSYAMPAEWAEHEATWIAWPQSREHWPSLEQVEPVFDNIAAAIAQDENVYICVNDEAAASRVRTRLGHARADLSRVFMFLVPTHDVWIRDYGPTFVTDPSRRRGVSFVRWRFNAWGGKYPDIAADSAVPAQIASILGMEGKESDLVLEGGSIDTNGAGELLTTEQCLLNPNRNPGLDRARIEDRLRETLGIRKVIWLAGGIEGDDTDGHVDDVARFVAEDRIVAVLPEDTGDADYAALRENYDRLESATNAAGARFDVTPLPAPRPVIHDGVRLPASYANFYVTNRSVLVPTFGDPADNRALGILARAFPDRKTVAVDSRELVRGLGAIHCATQQQPAGR